MVFILDVFRAIFEYSPVDNDYCEASFADMVDDSDCKAVILDVFVVLLDCRVVILDVILGILNPVVMVCNEAMFAYIFDDSDCKAVILDVFVVLLDCRVVILDVILGILNPVVMVCNEAMFEMIELVIIAMAVFIDVVLGIFIPFCDNIPDTARASDIVTSLNPPIETLLVVVLMKVLILYVYIV